MIDRYVTNTDRSVFCLLGLPEEVIAVLFAFYSRSATGLRDNLSKLLADQDLAVVEGDAAAPSFALATDKARAFHEKWTVGYGHASVAEHAVVHFACEGISILAAKALEDARLCSYTEKSTRYVVFDRNSFVVPLEVASSTQFGAFQHDCARLFDTYLSLTAEVTAKLEAENPREKFATELAWRNAARAGALDLLRGLLPAGTQTNVGVTVNARELTHMLGKLYAHPLAEVRALAVDIHREAAVVCPTLLKYAAPAPYAGRAVTQARAAAQQSLRRLAESPSNRLGPVRLLRKDEDALDRIVTGLLYDGMVEIESLIPSDAPGIGFDKKRQIVCAALQNRGARDGAPRAFEAATLQVEFELDYGAYRDLQRHRLLLPASGPLTPLHGFDVPAGLRALSDGAEGYGSLVDRYTEAMRRAYAAWEQIAPNIGAHAAQYVIPLGYKYRFLWTLNVRELIHVIELRSARQGHPSYRRAAQALYGLTLDIYPWLEGLVRVDLNDYTLARA